MLLIFSQGIDPADKMWGQYSILEFWYLSKFTANNYWFAVTV